MTRFDASNQLIEGEKSQNSDSSKGEKNCQDKMSNRVWETSGTYPFRIASHVRQHIASSKSAPVGELHAHAGNDLGLGNKTAMGQFAFQVMGLGETVRVTMFKQTGEDCRSE